MTIVAAYLLLCNSLLFLLMGIDKRKAVKRQWRIPEKTLLGLGLVGGGFGGILSMHLFRHKTTKGSFKAIFTLGTAVAIFLFVYFL